jgi:hypothetical protein
MNTDESMAGSAVPEGKSSHPMAPLSFAQEISVFIRLYPCSSVFQGFAPTIGTKENQWI